MSWNSLLITVLIYCSIILEHYGIDAAVTLLVESSGPLKNSSTLESKINEVSQRENERVTQKMLHTKDGRDAWRTDKGDLVELQHVKEIQALTSSSQSPEKSNIQSRTNEISDNSFLEPVAVYATTNHGLYDVNSGIRSSQRMKRTFWPFTSLFGYDYPPPPPYGMFGPPMMPPFGGGFGMGYPGPGPFGPPPPLFGLGFSLGF